MEEIRQQRCACGSRIQDFGRDCNLLPFTHVDNAVDCLLLATVSPEVIGQAYNVVDEPQVSVRDVVLQSMGITGEQLTPVPLLPFLLSVAGRLFQLKSSLGGSELPLKLSRFVVQSACRNICYDTRNAREQLGWQPAVSLEEGILRTFDEETTIC